MKNNERKSIGLILVICSVIVAVFFIGYHRFINNPQRRIDKESEELYSVAVQNIEKGDYDTAISILDEIDDSWSDYSKVEAERKRAVRDQMIVNITTYEAEGDYESIIEFINENVENIDGDSELKSIYDKSVQEYKDDIFFQVDEFVNIGDYDSAISILNTALGVVVEDVELGALYEKCVLDKPVLLSDLEPYAYEHELYHNENVFDTIGNVYDNVIESRIILSSKKECSEIYDISKNYNYLMATVAVDKLGKGGTGTSYIKIYGDDILLWEDTEITSLTKPYTIKVDITGVTDLKICMYEWAHSNLSDTVPVMICNPMLVKN